MKILLFVMDWEKRATAYNTKNKKTGIKMRIPLYLLLILMLSGCTSKLIPLEVYDAAGNVITGASSVVGDASVAKERAVMAAWKSYSTNYAKAYKSSGFDMQFALVNVGGVQTYLPTSISFKERPDMVAPPSAPSTHPVWGTINTVVKTVTPYGFGYLAIDSMTGAFQSFADNAGDRYNGPVNMSQSHNTAGNDQIFSGSGPFTARDAEIIGDDTTVNEAGPEPVVESEYPNGEWYSPGCSMDSHENGDC